MLPSDWFESASVMSEMILNLLASKRFSCLLLKGNVQRLIRRFTLVAEQRFPRSALRSVPDTP